LSSAWNIPVRDWASSELVAIPPETSLADAQSLFESRGISALPIVEHGALVGIISTTDLLRVARIEMESPRALARVWPPPHAVKDVMRSPVFTIDRGATLRAAAEALVAHRVHRLVVTSAGAPVGVLSTRDIARAILEKRVDAPLERVITTDVISVQVGDSIDVAVGRLADGNVHGLVVLDGAWPVGVFTHTEAIKARSLPSGLRAMPVEQIMSYETICMNVKTPLYRVAGHAMQMNVRRILAVDDRKLVGIMTGFDLARFVTMD